MNIIGICLASVQRQAELEEARRDAVGLQNTINALKDELKFSAEEHAEYAAREREQSEQMQDLVRGMSKKYIHQLTLFVFTGA